jgi:aminoglycoside phosphotransferase family enzyme/predicted kinase
MHSNESETPVDSDADAIAEAFLRSDFYRDEQVTEVRALETHISRIFLTENFAYKVKKPVLNQFVDYSTVEKRRHACLEELRLDRRFAPDLYLGVIPIHFDGHVFRLEGSGRVVEHAVKMRRFPDTALLSNRLEKQLVHCEDIRQLARSIAKFHRHAASVATSSPFGGAECIAEDAKDNLEVLAGLEGNFGDHSLEHIHARIQELQVWTERQLIESGSTFEERKRSGFVRECHGDLHSGNVIWWQERWQPFDGIEFNERFRWIDVLSDVGFLAMDLVALGHQELAWLLVNSYLEETGDYESLNVLRWYMVYRALVRAKVGATRLGQLSEAISRSPCQTNGGSSGETEAEQHAAEESVRLAVQEIDHYVEVAWNLSQDGPLHMWITHGLSGSGKSVRSESLLKRVGAIRVRSDVERRRLFSSRSADRTTAEGSELDTALDVYGSEMTELTYHRLYDLATKILKAKYPVIVDATFLKRNFRSDFIELASEFGVDWNILDCQAPLEELRRRIRNRLEAGKDASEANLEVLERQLRNRDPLTAEEEQRRFNGADK